DGEVRDHLHARAVAISFERGGDRRRRIALTARVASLSADDSAMHAVVTLLERRRALVLGGDRSDLDLHDAAVLVALHFLQLGARHARRDALEVGEHGPGLIDRHAHREIVRQLHVARSSWVSTSAGLPGHATSVT